MLSELAEPGLNGKISVQPNYFTMHTMYINLILFYTIVHLNIVETCTVYAQ